jgi:hypothetical protein
MKFKDIDQYMNRTFNSYSEYQSNYEEAKLNYLIRRKYLNLLGKFIENMYPGLKFDIYIQQRDPKKREMTWYGYTYMELMIFDVIQSPVYCPTTFDPVYRSPHCDEYINGENIYDLIDSFIPEINKHLLISFRPIISPHMEIHNMDFNQIPDYECWVKHWRYTRINNHGDYFVGGNIY